VTQVFEDVKKHDGGVLDLPDLKFRELIFIGALKRLDDGADPTRAEVVVDETRPMPPFREEGLFPPQARFTVERRNGRAHFTRVVLGARGDSGPETGQRAEGIHSGGDRVLREEG
jgi:hypothetical protein